MLLTFLSRSSRARMLVAIVLGLLSGLLTAGLLASVREVVMGARTLAGLDALPVFLALVAGLLSSTVLAHALIMRLMRDAVSGLRLDLGQRLLAVPLRAFEEIGAERVQVAAHGEIQEIAEAVTCIPDTLGSIAVIVAGLVYVGVRSPIALGLCAATAAVGALIFLAYFGVMKKTSAQSYAATTDQQREFDAITAAAKELRQSGPRREAFLTRKLIPAFERWRVVRRKQQHGSAVSFSLLSVLVWTTVGGLLFVVPDVERRLGYAAGGAVIIFLFLLPSFNVMLFNLQKLRDANFAAVRVFGLVDQLPAPAVIGRTPAPPAFARTLRWAGITHEYHREGQARSFVLGPIDLSVTKGETLFIVGGNGSGKTTLGKLLVGLYRPASGDVWVDEHAIRDEDAAEGYRQLFSSVFGDFHVFPWLLRATDADQARARALLSRLQLDGVVQLVDGELSSTRVSTGQRKRLALLHALLDDRPVYLFDEWAADQDPIFRRLFYEELLPELKAQGKTCLVITHDDRFFHVADRVIQLDQGQIVAPKS